MELTNLETELKTYADKLKSDLIKEIKSKGHEGKGKLTASIDVKFIKDGNNYKLSLSAFDYIQYLDGGDLLNNFLKDKEKEISDEVEKFVTKDIIKQIE